MTKDLIPIDTLLSSFGSIEGGIIILDTKGKVVYLNDWVTNHAVLTRDEYFGASIEEIFEGDISPALLSTVEDAIHSSLSRVLSYRIHNKILPLYQGKQVLDCQALSVSVSVTPLPDMAGILLRVVDYSSLVKREKQIRLNESLLKIERDFFKKASDFSLSTEDFVAQLIKLITLKVGVIDVHFSLLRGEQPVYRCFSGEPKEALLKDVEKIIRSKELQGSELDTLVMNRGREQSMVSSVIHFSDDSIKAVLAISKRFELMDLSLGKDNE